LLSRRLANLTGTYVYCNVLYPRRPTRTIPTYTPSSPFLKCNPPPCPEDYQRGSTTQCSLVPFPCVTNKRAQKTAPLKALAALPPAHLGLRPALQELSASGGCGATSARARSYRAAQKRRSLLPEHSPRRHEAALLQHVPQCSGGTRASATRKRHPLLPTTDLHFFTGLLLGQRQEGMNIRPKV